MLNFSKNRFFTVKLNFGASTLNFPYLCLKSTFPHCSKILMKIPWKKYNILLWRMRISQNLDWFLRNRSQSRPQSLRSPWPAGRETQRLWTNPKPDPGNPGSGVIVRVRQRLYSHDDSIAHAPHFRDKKKALATITSSRILLKISAKINVTALARVKPQ